MQLQILTFFYITQGQKSVRDQYQTGVNISIFERPSGREEFPETGLQGKSFWSLSRR